MSRKQYNVRIVKMTVEQSVYVEDTKTFIIRD